MMCCPMPSIKQRPLQRASVLPTSSQTCLKIDFTALGHPILTTSHNAMSLEYSDLALFWKMYICNPLVLEEFTQLDWRLSWDFHFDALRVFHGTLLNPFRPRNVKACVDEALHSSLHLANGRKNGENFRHKNQKSDTVLLYSSGGGNGRIRVLCCGGKQSNLDLSWNVTKTQVAVHVGFCQKQLCR